MMASSKPYQPWRLSSLGYGWMRSVSVPLWTLLLLVAGTKFNVVPIGVVVEAAGGGEIATLPTPPLLGGGNNHYNHTHRQNICHRYELFRAGDIELRDALQGIRLQPLMALGDFFNYDSKKGINREEPGLIADLMDALAERGQFTWRDSFSVMEEPETLNQTWTEMLLWGVENYDVAVSWWDQSAARMSLGVAYIEPWFDGSVILVDQKDPPLDVNTIHWTNWKLPFEDSVWGLTILTIILSALVYQLIEFLHHERDDRPIGQWFADNLYLSSLNFTQNFEYAPNSVAGRIFAISMGMWALVMTATYTANLASLFVQEQRPALVVDSIDQAIMLGIPICTMGLTNSDSMIADRYEDAKRVPKATELDAYQALRRGECGLYAAYKDNWLGYRDNSIYNPECDLEWVGRVVATIKSGFAVKADAGHLCSSLIRDVLNLHMVELINEGVLAAAWEKHRTKTKDQDCDVEESDNRRRRRLLGFQNLDGETTSTTTSSSNNYHRRMKGAKSAAAAGSNSSNQSSLTLQQMLGTFAFHWIAMAFSIVVALLTSFYQTRYRASTGGTMDQSIGGSAIERVTHRRHGPIIGSPPPVNTNMLSQRRFRTNLTRMMDEESRKPAVGQRRTSMHNNSPESSSDWRQSHAALESKQNDLTQQMNNMMSLLQEMSKQQQEVLQQQQKLLQRDQSDDETLAGLRNGSLGCVQSVEECAPNDKK